MSFGLRDADWVNPEERPCYSGTCSECREFEPCPCGCDWGLCPKYEGEFIDGTDSCEDGVFR